MAVKTEQTADQVRFIEGPEAGYDKATFAKDTYLCTDTGRLYMRGCEVTDPATAASIKAHIARKDNPHAVTKAQVGLGNVDNTAVKDMGISVDQIKMWMGTAGNDQSFLSGIVTGEYQNCGAFWNPGGVTVEYSRDSGATWTDYGTSDERKIQLSLGTATLICGKREQRSDAQDGDQLRVTLDFTRLGIYATVHCFSIYATECGYHWPCLVEVKTKGNDEFVKLKDNYWGGWPSWCDVGLRETTDSAHFGPNSGNQAIRFTLKKNEGSSDVRGILQGIKIVARYVYNTPSTMGRTGHLYSFDWQKNATFPAGLSATTLSATTLSAKTIQQNGVAVIDANGNGASRGAMTALMNAAAVSGSRLYDETYIVTTGNNDADTNSYRRRATTIWSYIQTKAETTAWATTLLSKLGQAADVPSDDTYVVLSGASAGDSTFYRRKLPLLAEYVAGKLPTASATAAGLMSAADKAALDGTAVARVALSASSQLPEDAGTAFMTADAAARDGRQLLLTMDSGQGAQATLAAVSVMTTGSLVMIDAFWNGKARRLTLTNTGGEVTVTDWADL